MRETGCGIDGVEPIWRRYQPSIGSKTEDLGAEREIDVRYRGTREADHGVVSLGHGCRIGYRPGWVDDSDAREGR